MGCHCSRPSLAEVLRTKHSYSAPKGEIDNVNSTFRVSGHKFIDRIKAQVKISISEVLTRNTVMISSGKHLIGSGISGI